MNPNNTDELIDNRINLYLQKVESDPTVTKEMRAIVDGPYRSFCKLITNSAKANDDPDEVAFATQSCMVNMIKELGLAVIGIEKVPERADMGRLFIMQLAQMWEDTVKDPTFGQLRSDAILRAKSH